LHEERGGHGAALSVDLILVDKIVMNDKNEVMDVQFTPSAHKHGATVGNIISVLNAVGEPQVVTSEDSRSVELWWFGTDDRGVELEVMGVERPDYLLVVHAMLSLPRFPGRFACRDHAASTAA